MDLYDKTCLECSKVITTKYSTSFALSVRMLHTSLRPAIYAIYGFVRLADEVVDTFHNHPKEKMLNELKAQTFEAISMGVSTNPALHSFQWAVNRYSIPHELINAFMLSMEMDLNKQVYSANEYRDYIYGSAEVVGLMCLMVFCNGNREQYDMLTPPARNLGEAFQKVNFLRDFKDDFLDKGRVYFPNVDFPNFSKADKRAIEDDIQNNLNLSLQGIRLLPKGAKLGVYLAYLFYSSLLNRIRAVKANELMNKRIRVSNFRKAMLLLRGAIEVALCRV